MVSKNKTVVKFNRLNQFIKDYETKLCLKDEFKPGAKVIDRGTLDYKEYANQIFEIDFNKQSHSKSNSKPKRIARSKLRVWSSLNYEDLIMDPKEIDERVKDNSFDYQWDSSMYALQTILKNSKVKKRKYKY